MGWLRRAHLAATALVGVQLVTWTVTGFAFTLFDFAAVRGDADRAPAPALDRAQVRLDLDHVLAAQSRSVRAVALKMLDGAPVYDVTFESGEDALVDARDGRAITIDEHVAASIATHGFRGPVHVAGVSRRDEDGRAVFVVRLDDRAATDVLVDATTGDTRWQNRSWRTFDALWSLHVLGYVSRTSPAHWPLRIVGFLAAIAATSGAALLIGRLRRRRRPKNQTLKKETSWLATKSQRFDSA